MNRPRGQRNDSRRAMAEQIVQKSYLAEIQLKAAMLVIHRVRRSMDLKMNSATDMAAQREALDKLATFADAHPLPPDLEGLL